MSDMNRYFKKMIAKLEGKDVFIEDIKEINYDVQ